MANIGFRILPAPKRAPAALLKQFRNVVVAHLSDCMNRLPGADGLDPIPAAFTSAGVALGALATVLYFAREVPRGQTYFVYGRALPGGGTLSVGATF